MAEHKPTLSREIILNGVADLTEALTGMAESSINNLGLQLAGMIRQQILNSIKNQMSPGSSAVGDTTKPAARSVNKSDPEKKDQKNQEGGIIFPSTSDLEDLKGLLYDEFKQSCGTPSTSVPLFSSDSSINEGDGFKPANASEWPPVDIFETSKCFKINVSLPGASKQDIEVEYDKETNEISITGEIKPTEKVEKSDLKPLLQEIRIGKFERVLSLPDDYIIDENKIGAKFNNGILQLSVNKINKKKEKETKKKISIN